MRMLNGIANRKIPKIANGLIIDETTVKAPSGILF